MVPYYRSEYKKKKKKITRLKTIQQLKDEYLWNDHVAGISVKHSTQCTGGTLIVRHQHKKFFDGRRVSLEMVDKKANREIWRVTDIRGSQMVYDEWFVKEENFLDDKLFEI